VDLNVTLSGRLRLVSQYRRHAAASALAVAVLVLLVAVAWPARAVWILLAGGVLAAITAVVVPSLLARRNPYFRNRDEVQRELNLRVLATCAPGSDR
jgi:hypothetical protein